MDRHDFEIPVTFRHRVIFTREAFATGNTALPVAIALTGAALLGVGATLSLFTGRSALYSALRMLGIGAVYEFQR